MEVSDRFFTTTTEFSIHIEELAKTQNISHLEALSQFCEETGADYDDAASLVSPTLKQKIYEEAVKTYSMPKQTSVTLDDI
jgi:uncharacterized protein YabE (DUF348 family)